MHSTGLQFASFPALVAGGCVVTDGSPRFEPTRVLSAVQRHRATSIAIVGDAFARPLLNALDDSAAEDDPYDCASLRCIASAGLTWSADVKRGLLRHIPHVALVEACGSTEGAYYGTEITRDGDEIVTGRFTAAAGVKIVDDDLREVVPGVTGRIAAPTVAAGYLGDTHATERSFTEFDGVRYTIPGDLGRIDRDGTLVLIGRGTSVINRGGEKVFPQEIEQVLLEHPAVDDALVFGLPDERLGQSVAAIVGVRVGDEPALDELRTLLSIHLASDKVPRLIMIAEVPRFPNGKPDYAAATELATAADRRSTS
jgi:fatty-acyl-CoA synthase